MSSATSGGIVYTTASGTAGSPALLERYGVPIYLNTGNVIPRGTWICEGTYAIVDAAGGSHTMPGGWMVSDGVNATVTASEWIHPFGV